MMTPGLCRCRKDTAETLHRKVVVWSGRCTASSKGISLDAMEFFEYLEPAVRRRGYQMKNENMFAMKPKYFWL